MDSPDMMDRTQASQAWAVEDTPMAGPSRTVLVLALLAAACQATPGASRRDTSEPVPPGAGIAAAATATPTVASATPPPSSSPAPVAADPPVLATPPPPPEPPYDLAADRDRIVAHAREELGPGTLAVTVDDVFVLIGPAGWNRTALRTSEKLVRDAVAAYLHGRFDRGPTHAIAVYLFPSADPYRRYCRASLHEECISPFGFYMDGKMIMNAGPGLGTLTHELVHPFVDADFPHAPIWINEGIASLFEAPVIPRPGEIRGVKNWRHPRLLRALSSSRAPDRDAASLARLFGMPDTAFRDEDEDLHYAMARYVCQWLDERKMLWPFYRRWRDTFEKDPTGAQAFAEVVGTSPAEANAAWTKWARAL
jgi:hypothetical protein